MGTTGPWRTPFGSAQRAHSNHPPPGSDKPIIKGLLRVAAPIREVLDHAHVDPSPSPQGFALLGQALYRMVLTLEHRHGPCINWCSFEPIRGFRSGNFSDSN